jgi:uncharacterized membrane protein required for colicin V production
LTLLDWGIVALVVLFAIRGWSRGTIGQVFGLAGVFLGVAVAVVITRWVGVHWQGARPAVVFLVLRWLVAALGGLAGLAVMQWCGERFRGAVHDGPLGWLDRLVGIPFGAALGVMVVACLLVVVLLYSPTRRITSAAARARVTPTLLDGGVRACALGGRVLPEALWLQRHFAAAQRRAGLHAHRS